MAYLINREIPHNESHLATLNLQARDLLSILLKEVEIINYKWLFQHSQGHVGILKSYCQTMCKKHSASPALVNKVPPVTMIPHAAESVLPRSVEHHIFFYCQFPGNQNVSMKSQ